jgi:hypothetical protein
VRRTRLSFVQRPMSAERAVRWRTAQRAVVQNRTRDPLQTPLSRWKAVQKPLTPAWACGSSWGPCRTATRRSRLPKTLRSSGQRRAWRVAPLRCTPRARLAARLGRAPARGLGWARWTAGAPRAKVRR